MRLTALLLLTAVCAHADDDIAILPTRSGGSFSELVSTEVSPSPRSVSLRTPLSLEVGAGWVSTRAIDPYGRAGAVSFTLGTPTAGVELRADTWYAEFAGQLMRSRLANRSVSASVARTLFRTGPLAWDAGLEGADVRFRREDFRTGDVEIGTSRTATIGLVSAGIGFGRPNAFHARATGLGGWYQNRYGSVVDLPGFSGDEPLADDEVPVYGARMEFGGLVIANRVELGGSVRHLRLSGSHASSVPDSEWSGNARLTIRLFGIRRKSLFVGAFARFGPATPALITDKSFGLRGIWKLK